MGTVSIPLTQDKYALIDEEDADLVLSHKWYASKSARVGGPDTWYARAAIRDTNQGNGRRQRVIEMHRLILDFPGGMVDHENGNSLDNRRTNLRICTNSQNQQNRSQLTTNSSGFRGVTWNKKSNKWQASIKHHQRSIYLGLFDCIEEAALAYDAKAMELFGSFARLNFAAKDAA